MNKSGGIMVKSLLGKIISLFLTVALVGVADAEVGIAPDCALLASDTQNHGQHSRRKCYYVRTQARYVPHPQLRYVPRFQGRYLPRPQFNYIPHSQLRRGPISNLGGAQRSIGRTQRVSVQSPKSFGRNISNVSSSTHQQYRGTDASPHQFRSHTRAYRGPYAGRLFVRYTPSVYYYPFIYRTYYEEPAQPTQRSTGASTSGHDDSGLALIAIIGVAFIVLPFVADAIAADGVSGVVEEEVAAGARVGAEPAATSARIASTESAEEFGNDVYTIGKLEDTRNEGTIFTPKKKLDVLFWTPERNNAYIREIISTRSKVKLATPPTSEFLFDSATGEQTWYGRELDQLEHAGYTRKGRMLIPPSK